LHQRRVLILLGKIVKSHEKKKVEKTKAARGRKGRGVLPSRGEYLENKTRGREDKTLGEGRGKGAAEAGRRAGERGEERKIVTKYASKRARFRGGKWYQSFRVGDAGSMGGEKSRRGGCP